MTNMPAASGGRRLLSARFVAPAACVLFGLVISILPHFLWWSQVGAPVWIADNDELLYLAHAGQAYFNHPAHLSDPVLTSHGPAMYPWLQMVPGILVAKLFQVGPMAISLIWRAWAGASIALGWYLLASFYLKKPWLAAALSSVLMADGGIVAAHPIWGQLIIAAKILAGRTHDILDRNPAIHGGWRIITPALSLAYLLLHIWLVARAREVPTRPRILLAGLGLGILFYTYFFYWTAACLAVAVVFFLDAKNRKVYWQTACLGVLFGLPSLLATFLLKRSASPEWPVRTDLAISIPRFSELLIPKIAIVLLVITLVWVWKRRRDLIYIWTLAASAMLLMNHQVFTRMQTQNEHWAYVWGPCLSFLLVFAAGDVLSRFAAAKRLAPPALAVFVVCYSGAGLWLRAVEARRTRESTDSTQAYAHYREQPTASPSGLTPNAVIAGDRSFVDLAAIVNNQRPLDHYAVVMSPSIDNSEWDSRVALNGFLLGLDKESFGKSQKEVLDHTAWGLEARDPARRAERLASRLGKYEEIAASPGPALDRFKVKYVALPTKDAPPPAYLTSNWRPVVNGPYWQVWERE
jgi:hypothetical protein